MIKFKQNIPSEPADFSELSQMIETGEGEIKASDFRRLAETEEVPENLRALVKFAADLIEEKDKWGTDFLTGLMAESRLNRALEGLFSRSQKSGEVITIVLYDLNKLKGANSAGEGHKGGDKLIQALAQSLSAVYNPQNGEFRTGIVGRWRKGDEFLAAVRGDENLAQGLDEKFQSHLKSETIEIAGKPYPLSATGIVCELAAQKDLAPQLEETSKKLVKKKMKQSGQNEELESPAIEKMEEKVKKRERKKKKKMDVSGKDVFKIKELKDKKNLSPDEE